MDNQLLKIPLKLGESIVTILENNCIVRFQSIFKYEACIFRVYVKGAVDGTADSEQTARFGSWLKFSVKSDKIGRILPHIWLELLVDSK